MTLTKEPNYENNKQLPLVSIVIATNNFLDYIIMCIDSIRCYTKNISYEIIVVDNASDDTTLHWLSCQNDISLIKKNENIGYVESCNEGIKLSKGKFVLLLNYNVIVTHNWLSNMMNCMDSDNKIGAVGTVTNYCGNNQNISLSYDTIDEMQNICLSFNNSNPELWEERIKLSDFNMLIRKESVIATGLLDTDFSPGHFEDEDYSFKLIEKGYKLMLISDTFIHHYPGVSYKEAMSDTYETYAVNLNKFSTKWGFNPVYSCGIRNDLIGLIKEPSEKNIRILEIGCACGATLLKLKYIYPKSELYGIELNQGSAKIAEHFAHIQAADIEGQDLEYPCNYFDYIIMGDVLEHLKDPWSALSNLKKHLKSHGKFVASIPNIMHFSVISNLLNGNWTYEDSGILDRTHYRFFTIKEVNDMFLQAGYCNIITHNIYVNMSENDVSFVNKLCSLTSEQYRNQYMTYQILVTAEGMKENKNGSI